MISALTFILISIFLVGCNADNKDANPFSAEDPLTSPVNHNVSAN